MKLLYHHYYLEEVYWPQHLLENSIFFGFHNGKLIKKNYDLDYDYMSRYN